MIKINAAARLKVAASPAYQLSAATADAEMALKFVSQMAGIHVTTRDMDRTRGQVSFDLDEAKFKTAQKNLTKQFGKPKKSKNSYNGGDFFDWDLGEGRTIRLAGNGKPVESDDSSRNGKVLYLLVLKDAHAFNN